MEKFLPESRDIFLDKLRLTEEQYKKKWAFIEQSGKYQFRGIIGGGGMGRVYHAKDVLTHRDAAIKVLWKGEGSYYKENPEDAVTRFDLEIAHHCNLTKNPHKNILQRCSILFHLRLLEIQSQTKGFFLETKRTFTKSH